jgi:hypothetical protein
MQKHTSAQINAETALYVQARRSAAFLVKQPARAFAKCPLTLENVRPGLTAAAPETMLAVAAHLFEAERNTPRWWFGFGGEVPILNAKALMLLARAWRRAQSRLPAN